ncbi:MAG: cell division protein FtsX, partial [Haemophilus parainfluenzae]|nr:cell division protein FtsX [Haemophilus parainfluenzae]
VMKLLGATDQFILRPYLYTGMIYAVLGGFVAAVFSSLIVGYFTSAVKYVTDIFAVTFELNGLGVGELIFLLVSCLIMGYVGAWIAATRHIAMLDNKL